MPLDSQQEKQLHEAIFAGQKIEAIKIYREANNCGLKETLRNQNAQRFEKAEVKGGCFGVLVLCFCLTAVALFAML